MLPFKLIKKVQFTTTSAVIYYTVEQSQYVKIHSPVKQAFIIVSLQPLTVSGGEYQVGRGRSTVYIFLSRRDLNKLEIASTVQ